MTNLLIDNYNITIKNPPVTVELKTLEFYKTIPDFFLKHYTTLTDKEIKEISFNKELTDTMVNEVYKNLTIINKSNFIKITNKSIKLINSLSGVIIFILKQYYGYKIIDLISKSEDELLTLFILELKLGLPNDNFSVDMLKDAIKQIFDEETANDFINNCCDRLIKKSEEDFQRELEELNNL